MHQLDHAASSGLFYHDPGETIILSTVLLFGLAAFFGLFLTVMGVRYHRGSMALGLTHAGIASLALALLTVQIFRDSVNHMLYNDATILFIVTLLAGLVMLALRMGKEPPPMVVVGIHAVIALLALLLLVLGYAHH